jgi:hypothetical protein
MAVSYLWSNVLTPWLLVRDGAILTASPAVHLQKLKAGKTFYNYQDQSVRKIVLFPKTPLILLFNNCTVNFCLII